MLSPEKIESSGWDLNYHVSSRSAWNIQAVAHFLTTGIHCTDEGEMQTTTVPLNHVVV